MRGNGYFEASGQNLTLPFAPATSISCNRGHNSSIGIHFPNDLAISLARISRNSDNSGSGPILNVTIYKQETKYALTYTFKPGSWQVLMC